MLIGQPQEEFIGPFASWLDAKRDFGSMLKNPSAKIKIRLERTFARRVCLLLSGDDVLRVLAGTHSIVGLPTDARLERFVACAGPEYGVVAASESFRSVEDGERMPTHRASLRPRPLAATEAAVLRANMSSAAAETWRDRPPLL